jgi:hypothetical protein
MRANYFEPSKEGHQSIGASAFFCMDDFSSFQVQYDGHVMMAFTDCELIDSNQSNVLDGSRFQASPQVPLEGIPHDRPSDIEQPRNMLDRGDSTQFNNEPLECLDMAPFALCKSNRLTELLAASITPLFVTV